MDLLVLMFSNDQETINRDNASLVRYPIGNSKVISYSGECEKSDYL